MKEKIFSLLKGTYSSLGLGDAILDSLAETLAVTGLVTDENMQQVVTAQKGYLEAVQKGNDKRVTDALAKAKAESEQQLAEAAKKAAEDEHAKALKLIADEQTKIKAEAEQKAKELQAQYDEVIRKLTLQQMQQKPEPTPEPKPNEGGNGNATPKPSEDIPGWYKAIREAEKAKEELAAKQRAAAAEEEQKQMQAAAAKRDEERKAFEAQLQQLMESNKTLLEGLKSVQERNEAYEREKAEAKRNSFIADKVKELGIPEWRVKEGFSIKPDDTEDAITSYLGAVADNIKKLQLPTNKVGVPMGDDGSTAKEVINNLAASVVNKI